MQTKIIPHDCENDEVVEVNGPDGGTVWLCPECLHYTDGSPRGFKPLPDKARIRIAWTN